ncbi:LAMI_0E00694g1_1 [Lachancea mirantina]|uniref:6-phosphogluconolactonase n=1 Tax=Lachancea mirantina TaxID=1230905 RepID=A0A1G4JI71_9SACH|nr:LAMI_0E00694g1_1 [Lachancea mirantina]
MSYARTISVCRHVTGYPHATCRPAPRCPRPQPLPGLSHLTALCRDTKPAQPRRTLHTRTPTRTPTRAPTRTPTHYTACTHPIPMVSVKVPSTPAAFTEALAAYIIDQQDAALKRSNRFNVAISGGSLVSQLYEALVKDPRSAPKVHWAQWHIYFCDERLVPLNDPDSNYGAFKHHVLDPLLAHHENATPPILGPTCYAINESLVGLDENDRIADEYASLLPGAGFDLVLLGCGPDGHTCSLFPGERHAFLLEEQKRPVMWCPESPKPPADRITFTLPVLRAARALCFVAQGAGKRAVLQRILGGADGTAHDSADTPLPCARVNAECPHTTTWFLDTEAAGDIAARADM